MTDTVTIGIVGGGQLGRMLTLAALPLGFKVVVLDSSVTCPAGQVGAEVIVGDLYDDAALRELAARSDIVTVEIEHMNTDTLADLARSGKPVHPAPTTVKTIQDKYLQKQLLKTHDIAVAPFIDVPNKASARLALKKFGGAMILKTKHGAYDGRGNAVVRNQKELQSAWQHLGGNQLYGEALVNFTKELSVIIARSRDGEVKIYDVVEMRHERNICLEVIAPAQINKVAAKNAVTLAKKVSGLLEGAGVFAIEMFLLADNSVLVNEIAPRVHNSGHHTIEATTTSQFEQHIRAITGMPLGATTLLAPAAVMVNILGSRSGVPEIDPADLDTETDVSIHWYGKSPIKIDRKMGHITVLGDTVESARGKANQARSNLQI